jgi:hypothetical protein
MEERQTTFETLDSFLASFLLAKHRTIVAIRMDGRRKFGASFVFEDPDQKIGGPAGLEHEYFADGLAPARTLGRHRACLRRCVREQVELGITFDRQGLANIFPPNHRKKRGPRKLKLLQLRVLLFLCDPLFGDDRDARLLWASGIINRSINSFRELFVFEGEHLIDLLVKAAEKGRRENTNRARQCGVSQQVAMGVESGESPQK